MDTLIKTNQPEIDFKAPAPKRAAAAARRPRQSTNILQLIDRAARDPSVGIDKMERLIAMQERAQARAAEIEFDKAMIAAQMEMQPVRRDASNPETQSKYASYFELDEAIRPIYIKHGFSLSFDTDDGAPVGEVRVVCKVAHRGGHRERPHIDIPADGKNAEGFDVMSKTHAAVSAVTIGKRYLLGMSFNIVVRRDDDDGNAAGHRPCFQGSAGGGTQFRRERRSSWGRGGKAGALAEAERDGLTTNVPAKPLPAEVGARPAPQLTPEQERAAKFKAATDKRIEALRDGAGTWTRDTLNQFRAADKKWIDWMADPANGVLAEYERFTAAYSDAEANMKEVA